MPPNQQEGVAQMEHEAPARTTRDIAAAGADSEVGSAGERPEPDEADLTGDREHGATEQSAPLLADEQVERFRSQWQDIQATFVDEPRRTVERADALVADLMQRLAAEFTQTRTELEAQWDRGEDVSTEDLRVALTRYRSFFERLLSA